MISSRVGDILMAVFSTCLAAFVVWRVDRLIYHVVILPACALFFIKHFLAIFSFPKRKDDMKPTKGKRDNQ